MRKPNIYVLNVPNESVLRYTTKVGRYLGVYAFFTTLTIIALIDNSREQNEKINKLNDKIKELKKEKGE